ncbi:hypothetical protein AKJ37_00410 [candidate division MSBL1 archaeon SCGC-AAA259I09]|uniref:Uncharacterized protein n=3 Tax=candidate division MSBL1 TaxID=215777 RepID=A0A133UT44_9EURY|nr:hypothetical protein AKJ36_01055 [candidate division MSBL1 archaeon SCGC-AAA259I07]KXA97276.1 hypothetical protein AKJ38_01580 [candidate division MSBL1 archaeon SCGC-AAA259I14]KXA98363.1 hypothetical protein AKJ37_00410 [candidate division MSBL1 archaeon SCGC-AAA259I09]
MPEREESIKYSGLVVFFLGVGLLLLTFYIVYSVFMHPGALKGFAELAPEMKGEGAAELINPMVEVMVYVIAALLLWVMGSVGGRIAKHGLDMYRS